VADSENALITVDYARQMLGAEVDEIASIDNLIDAASSAANSYTKRKLKTRSHTVVLDGTGKNTLLLPEYPVTAFTSLFIDRDRTFGADTEITDYYVHEELGELYYGGTFPKVWKCVKAVFTAGYGTEEQPIPEDIKIAIIETVQWYRSRLAGEGIGVTAIQNPNGITTRYEADLPVSARRRLDAYVRPL